MARTFAAGNYIELANNAAFNSSVGSFAFWMKTTQTTGNTEIFGRHNASTSFSGFGLVMNNSAGKVQMYGKSSGAQVFGTNGTVSNINNGNWRHVAGVWDLSTAANAQKVYVDGVLDAQMTASAAWTQNNNVIRAARSIDSFWASYVGDMAEIAWWSQTLTANEILALATRVNPFKIRPGALEFYLPCWN